MLCWVLIARAESLKVPVEPLVVHASVGAVVQWVPMAAELEVARPPSAVRVEIGLGRPQLQAYAAFQTALHDAPSFWEDVRSDFAGDTRLTQMGLGARMPVPVGPLWVIPRLEAGVGLTDTGISQAFYRNDVLVTAPEVLPPHSQGLWVQGGVDLSLPLFADTVHAFVGPDVGYMSNAGVGLVMGGKLGVSARI